jgi:hypothetical protein
MLASASQAHQGSSLRHLYRARLRNTTANQTSGSLHDRDLARGRATLPIMTYVRLKDWNIGLG